MEGVEFITYMIIGAFYEREDAYQIIENVKVRIRQ